MALRSTKLSGKNPLAYLGVEPSSPPAVVWNDIDPLQEPTSIDNFFIGDIWINNVTHLVWMVTSITNGELVWTSIGFSNAFLSTFVTADGNKATAVLGEMNIKGGNGMRTIAVSNNIYITMKAGLNGQLMISGGTSPELGYLVSSDDSIVVTNLAHAIQLRIGTTGITSIGTDEGPVTPLNHYYSLVGSLNISTTGVDDTVTVTLKDSVTITGSLTVATLNGGVVKSNLAGVLSVTNGDDGQILIGSSTGDPIWASLTSSDDSITITPGHNSISIDVNQEGIWTNLGGDTGFAYDDGTGTVQLLGGKNVDTEKLVSDVSIYSSSNLKIDGSLRISSLGAGIVRSSALGVLSSTNGTNGQTLIGGGTSALWSSITSTGGSITLTPGANSLSLAVSGSAGLLDALKAQSGTGYAYINSTTDICYMYPYSNPSTGSTTANIETLSTGNTVIVSLGSRVSTLGTFKVSPLHGVVLCDDDGLLYTPTGTPGQLLIGASTGAQTVQWGDLYSSDSSVAISHGDGYINIEMNAASTNVYSFLYTNEATAGAVLGGATPYYLGKELALVKMFDNGDNVYPGDPGTSTEAYFTAPKTGKYFLNMTLTFNILNLDNLASLPQLGLIISTTKRTYYHIKTQAMGSATGFLSMSFATIADMDVSDIATFACVADMNGSSGTARIYGANNSTKWTTISGYLVIS